MKFLNVKVSKVLTLSNYKDGTHIIDGEPSDYPSFAESLSPIKFMLEKFKGLATGRKIKVTIETVGEKV